jgi:hypothetical protein
MPRDKDPIGNNDSAVHSDDDLDCEVDNDHIADGDVMNND